jgi:hypothetical protein
MDKFDYNAPADLFPARSKIAATARSATGASTPPPQRSAMP